MGTWRVAGTWAATILLSSCGVAAPSSEPIGIPARVPPYEYGRLIVKFEGPAIGKAASREDRAAAARDRLQAALPQVPILAVRAVAGSKTARAPGGAIDLSNVFLLELEPSVDPQPLVPALEAREDVAYAAPLYVQQLAAEPDDLHPDQRQALTQIHLPEAWDLTRGEMGTVLLAIVDSGVDWMHPDLAANIWRNPGEIDGNGLDDDRNGYVDDVRGWSFTEGSPEVSGPERPNQNARHGTLVAGVASAVTNNGLGIAGAAWNVRILPVRVAHPTLPGGVRDGYLGIIYAVENGAEIVNMSWISPTISPFERDVIDWAWEHGVVLVAAAGNIHAEERGYPAALRRVFTVASVDSDDVASRFTTFGGWVDVSAPGENILGARLGSGVETASGTSLAAPLASGICALVKTRWPQAAADEVMERVRSACDSIDASNPAEAGLLGRGRLNAFRALTEDHPAIRIVDENLVDGDGDDIVEAGELLDLTLRVRNHLAGVDAVELTLSSASPTIAVLDAHRAVGAMPHGSSRELTFQLRVDDLAPPHELVRLRLDIVGDGYADADYAYVLVEPGFVDHWINNIQTSLGTGRIGHTRTIAGSDEDGIGFRYKESEDLVGGCGLMIGVSPQQVSDAVRGLEDPSFRFDGDFVSQPGGAPTWSWRDAEEWHSLAVYDDSGAGAPIGVVVRQEGIQYARSPYDDFVLLKTTLQNAGVAPLQDLRVGFVIDWSIDRSSCCDANEKAVDPAHDLGYAWSSAGAAQGHRVGVAVLTPPGLTSYQLVDDAQIYRSGFSTEEKWTVLRAGIDSLSTGRGNLSMAIGTGPFTIEVGASVTVGFAFLGGDDLADLQHNVQSARAAWRGEPRPSRVFLSPPRRNPVVAADAVWSLVVPEIPANVRVRVYDVRGTLVRDLSSTRLFPGTNVVRWDARDGGGTPVASGVYWLHVDLGGQRRTSKFVVLH